LTSYPLVIKRGNGKSTTNRFQWEKQLNKSWPILDTLQKSKFLAGERR
jgi:hypothetical protein